MKLDYSLGYLLNVSARLMKQRLDNGLRKYSLTTSQWAILKILSEHDEMTQVEIASLIHSDKATCGTILFKLQKKQMIEKIPSLEDKRAYKIRLTNQAEDMMEEITLEAEKCNQIIEQRFEANEIEELKRMLNSMIYEMERVV